MTGTKGVDKAALQSIAVFLCPCCVDCILTTGVQGGYETTASALSFTIYNLAANPDNAAKLMEVCTHATHAWFQITALSIHAGIQPPS